MGGPQLVGAGAASVSVNGTGVRNGIAIATTIAPLALRPVAASSRVPSTQSSGSETPFRIIALNCRLNQVEFMALADPFLTPLISSNVEEYADQPCLLIPQAA